MPPGQARKTDRRYDDARGYPYRVGEVIADYGDLVQINQNANRAAALVGQLLAFSRKQTMQPEVTIDPALAVRARRAVDRMLEIA